MLKLKVTTLEGLAPDEAKHYVQRDGAYFFDGGSVDGLTIENVGALKKALETERNDKEKALTTVADLTKRFDGIEDPEEAKTALTKYKEIKNWNGDQKIAEAVEASKRDLLKLHTTEKTTLQTELDATLKQLEEATVDRAIQEALAHEEVKGNATLMMPHVRKFVRWEKGADGKRYTKVIGADGQPRVGDSAGNPMTLVQLCKEMKQMPEYSDGFKGTGSSGGGGGGINGGTPKIPGVRVVSGSGTVIANDLEKIASGEVTVTR